ncbi:MAG: PQQ-dependent sugar dehydrogenase [Steroidobacteraceae bacterium]
MSASAASATQIIVSWQPSADSGAGVAGYHVFRNGGVTAIAVVSNTSYTDGGLTPATQYSYSVRAFDAATPANESALSAAAITTTAPIAGLDARPDNTTCLAGDRPAQDVTLATERAFASLPAFSSPILLLQGPGDATRWFVVEQRGTVRVFDNQPAVATSSSFVDISARVRSGGEQGLLGMAFHPGFPTDPRVYLSYTNATSGLVSRVSEFRTRDGGATLDPASEVILLTVAQPEINHNGGHIAFGPDGLLYIGLGDGGSGGDPWGTIGNGQNLRTLLGKLLRIDVNGSTGNVPYRIPASNPYAGNALCNSGTGAQNCPEIYAYGLRNPWRWSFDRLSGELWLADVGQGAIEEVDRIVSGGNYGWRCFEGTGSYNSTCGPNAASSLPPVAQYSHAVGQSITGGYVYRGAAMPALVGRYVFGDFVSGRIWHIARDTAPTLSVTAGFDSGLSIASFGQGIDGELYVVNYGGTLHRLRQGTTSGGSVASQLSATGCVLAGDPTKAAAGLVPYAPNAPFWSDGAAKERYLALPNGATMSVAADGDIEFPAGTVLMKHFRLGGRLVETRLFMRHTDGEWAGYSYQWNAQGTDATRVVGGKTASIGTQSWMFPSEAQCLACHTAAAGRSLGLEIAQLNGPLLYAATGRTANQIATLNAIGKFSPAITTAPAALPALPDPFGSAGTLNERARAYLQTNCAQCHRPNGGTPTDLDLRYTTSLVGTNGCDRPPQAGEIGLANARIIAPGAADRSVLVARVNRRDAQAMPPLASTVVDAAGVDLLTRWVNSLTGCN